MWIKLDRPFNFLIIVCAEESLFNMYTCMKYCLINMWRVVPRLHEVKGSRHPSVALWHKYTWSNISEKEKNISYIMYPLNLHCCYNTYLFSITVQTLKALYTFRFLSITLSHHGDVCLVPNALYILQGQSNWLLYHHIAYTVRRAWLFYLNQNDK